MPLSYTAAADMYISTRTAKFGPGIKQVQVNLSPATFESMKAMVQPIMDDMSAVHPLPSATPRGSSRKTRANIYIQLQSLTAVPRKDQRPGYILARVFLDVARARVHDEAGIGRYVNVCNLCTRIARIARLYIFKQTPLMSPHVLFSGPRMSLFHSVIYTRIEHAQYLCFYFLHPYFLILLSRRVVRVYFFFFLGRGGGSRHKFSAGENSEITRTTYIGNGQQRPALGVRYHRPQVKSMLLKEALKGREERGGR